jgi:hypothetical protein
MGTFSFLPLLVLLADVPAAPAHSGKDFAAFETSVKPFLAKSCYACHNALLKNADLNLEAFATPEAILADPDTWDKVVMKMKTGQMPPVGFPRPEEAEVAALTRWIEDEFQEAERRAPTDPGRVTARRLNRTEYNNTVRDLLAVDLRPADDFPQDDAGYGFDNNGDVLSVSPALMEKYLLAAEKAARVALFGPDAPKPALVRLTPARAKIDPSPIPLTDYDTTGQSLPQSVHATYRFPIEAEYVLQRLVYALACLRSGATADRPDERHYQEDQ